MGQSMSYIDGLQFYPAYDRELNKINLKRKNIQIPTHLNCLLKIDGKKALCEIDEDKVAMVDNCNDIHIVQFSNKLIHCA